MVSSQSSISITEKHDYQFLGPYQIIKEIGRGGMGRVYLAKDRRLKRHVAIKCLHPDLCKKNNHTQFKREALTIAQLNHPSIVQLYDVVEKKNGTLQALVMELVTGSSLRDAFGYKPLPLMTALDITLQISLGIAAAHKKGFIHRDIKYDNIILNQEGQVKITDFGIASLLQNQSILSTSDIITGSIVALSPEQACGAPLDFRCDIFAIGLLLYQMLTGIHPFLKETSNKTLRQIIEEPHPPVKSIREEIPDDVSDLCDLLLAKQPLHRISNAHILSKKIKSIIENITKNLSQQTLKHSLQISGFHLIKNRKKETLVHPCNTTQNEKRIPRERKRKESNLNKPRYKYRWLLVFFSVILVLFVYIYKSSTSFRESELPTKKNIAIVSLQNNLSDLELGLVEMVSKTMLLLSERNDSIWIIPNKRVKEYQISNLNQINETFGTNLIIDINIMKINNTHSIRLSLIDSSTLKNIRSSIVAPLTSNVAVMQETIVLKLKKLINFRDQQGLKYSDNFIGTTNVLAYKKYLTAVGLLSRADQKHNIQDALELLNSTIEMDPNYLSAYYKLANCYWLLYTRSKKIEYAEKSEKLYEDILLKNPNDVNIYLSLGKLHYILARYGTALASYQLALQFGRNTANIYKEMAAVYEKTGELDLAEKYFAKSIVLQPNYWNGYNDIGAFYLRQGRYSEAVEKFKKVVELTPSNAWGYSNLGSAYWYLGKLDETINNFRHSLSIRDNYTIHKNLATLHFHQQNYDDALIKYEKALSINSNDYKMWGYLAATYYYLNKDKNKIKETFKKAIDLAHNVEQITPDDTLLNANLSSYYAWIGQIEEAMKYLNKVIHSNSLGAKEYYQIAVIYEKLKQSDEAIEWIKKAMDKNYPKNIILDSPDLKQLRQTKMFKDLFLLL